MTMMFIRVKNKRVRIYCEMFCGFCHLHEFVSREISRHARDDEWVKIMVRSS